MFPDSGWEWTDNARLAWDTFGGVPTTGIPSRGCNLMDIPLLEEFAGVQAGDYERDPENVYLAFQRNTGACCIDQFIPRNPLTMTRQGYGAEEELGATTGAEHVELDGIVIDSPEAVVEHMETVVFPGLRAAAGACGQDDDTAVRVLIDAECDVQRLFGPVILKSPYGRGFNNFPCLRYGAYGYVNYFMAYALYPEVMETDFSLQADVAAKRNAIGAQAILEGGLPRAIRLDHDMADSRSTLVDLASLDRIWFPHFARSIRPYVDAGIRLLWHCDGNLMGMVPRLLEVGLGGFQGFQYEDGMDYEAICRMTDRDGNPLMIQAGVSVTTTLPRGTTSDVVDQLKWLVANGPKQGLFLGASSSIAPGTKPDNVRALFEGRKYYREHGRG